MSWSCKYSSTHPPAFTFAISSFAASSPTSLEDFLGSPNPEPAILHPVEVQATSLKNKISVFNRNWEKERIWRLDIYNIPEPVPRASSSLNLIEFNSYLTFSPK